MTKFVRLTMLCPAASRAAFNAELADALGPAFANTFETVYSSGATKYYFAGWQGDPETAEQLRDLCAAYSIECYDTPPEGAPIDPTTESVATRKTDTPTGGKKLLYPQTIVLDKLGPESLK